MIITRADLAKARHDSRQCTCALGRAQRRRVELPRFALEHLVFAADGFLNCAISSPSLALRPAARRQASAFAAAAANLFHEPPVPQSVASLSGSRYTEFLS
jgi:hypothetical protein